MKFIITMMAFFLLAISGCGGTVSEDDIQQEFSVEVELSNDCTEVSQCTIIYAGCPLGCGVAVNTEHAEELEATARRLIRKWEGYSQSCAYECIPAVAECRQNKCEAELAP